MIVIGHHPPPQIQYLLPNPLDRVKKHRIALLGGVIKAPVLPVAAGQGRALDVAAHRHHDVHGGQVGQQFAVLGGFHVDAVNLLHQAHGILVDLRLYLGPGGVALEGIGGQGFAQARQYINMGNLDGAERILQGAGVKNGEWYFLMGSIAYRRGWLDEARQNYQIACQMEPGNLEYRQALNMMQQGGYGYRPDMAGGQCDSLDCCTSLLCLNCMCGGCN